MSAFPIESLVTPITDWEPVLQAAQALAVGIPPVFRLDALRQKRWVCVAIEDELDRGSAAMLGAACIEAEFGHGWAVEVPWSAEDKVSAAYHLPLTPEGLETVARDVLIGSGFVIGEMSTRFAVASDGDLYWALAGDPAFVEAAVGQTLQAQLDKFERVVTAYNSGSDPQDRWRLAGSILAAVQGVARATVSAL